MSWRPATKGDVGAVGTFLRQHIQSSMFPLANLRAHGLGSDAPRGLRLWLQTGADGEICGVYGETNEGMAMPQLPHASATDWAALAERGCGQRLIGALGAADQVEAMLRAWRVPVERARHNGDEPGFALDLSDLVVPPDPADSHLVQLDAVAPELLRTWRAAYHVETLGTPETEAAEAAASDIARWRQSDTHRVLIASGHPVALTGFNAVVDDTVQIGAVYTPPRLRKRGLARRALALHLAEARGTGTARAVLFAASEAAARAYTAVGFRRAGSFAMVLFDPSEPLSAQPPACRDRLQTAPSEEQTQ